MSRIANNPVEIPKGVDVAVQGRDLAVKGSNGNLRMQLHKSVEVKQDGDVLTFSARNNAKAAVAMTGTTRSLVSNMVLGVSQGFERKLQLQGVGYRAAAKGRVLNLVLGFSHPIDYKLPEGVSAETPTPTEIVLKCADKQLLGQAAAKIRSFRPPEPYKGKGVRYENEYVRRKEAKKK